MNERHYNPFQTIDLSVPVEFRESFSKYCQTRTEGARSIIDQSPFPRMVDMWFLAVCIAAREGLQPDDINKYDTYKIIEGTIFSSDPWRINTLMLLAIGITGDVEIVNKPRQIMTLANGLAIKGLPRVIEMLQDGEFEPIWNLSDNIEEILRKDN